MLLLSTYRVQVSLQQLFHLYTNHNNIYNFLNGEIIQMCKAE